MTAASLPWPNALFCAKTVIVLPSRSSRKVPAVATSCALWRPERKVYSLMPVIASAAAGPETKSTWFCAACSATASATPDDALPPMMLTPAPMSSLTAVTALSGSPASSRVLDGDRRAVDLARAVGRVVEAGLESVEVLLAVARERPGLARDDADRDLGRTGRRLGRVAARCGGLRRAGRQDERGRGDHGAQEQLLRNPHVRAFHRWKVIT